MKNILCLAALLCFCPGMLKAQTPPTTNPQLQDSIKRDTNVKVKADVVAPDTNSKKILVKDTTAHIRNMYLGLLNDDPIYNKQDALWIPIAKICVQNILLNLTNHYILHNSWSIVGFSTWNRTAIHSGFPWSSGWKWDEDRFGNNYLLHPYTGANYFSSMRASGYDYWESSVGVLFGAYTWKLFGENGEPDFKPEREDVINTTLGGMWGGEVIYRLSSNVIDERTTGSERVGREILAFFLSPSRTVTRLLQGKLFNHNTEEVYQKEPLDVTVTAGGVHYNNNTASTSPTTGVTLTADFDYGDPFEVRFRKPYDYFEAKTSMNIGVGRKVIDNIVGYGILGGENTKIGGLDILAGLFQHFDFWDNKNFELGTFGFGPSAITKYTVAKGTNLYTNLGVALIPFGANSTGQGDTSSERDYVFCGGAQAKLDVALNIQGVVSLSMLGYYYWLHTYVGPTGYNLTTILKPRIEFHLFDKFGIGFEHRIHFNDQYLQNAAVTHFVSTEEKLFLVVYFADFLPNR